MLLYHRLIQVNSSILIRVRVILSVNGFYGEFVHSNSAGDLNSHVCSPFCLLIDLEIELTCMDDAGKASGMGILGRYEPGQVGNAGGMNGGVMISCSLELSRRLADATNFPLLEKLSHVSCRCDSRCLKLDSSALTLPITIIM